MIFSAGTAERNQYHTFSYFFLFTKIHWIDRIKSLKYRNMDIERNEEVQ